MVKLKKMIRYILLVYLCWLPLAAQTNTNNTLPKYLHKTVKVGEDFSIRIYTENTNELYMVSALDYAHLSNTGDSSGPGHISFFFKALKAGETKLVIDKIANKITKNFLDYKITVKKNKKQLAAAASRRRQIKKEAQKERAGYELIRKLYQDEQYETALKHIRQYKKNNPTGPYLTPNTMIEAAILTNRGQPEKAVSLLSNLLTAAGKKKNPAGRSKTMFSLAKIYLQAGDTNRGLDILYRLEADYHGTPLYSKALLKLADTLYAGQKYRQAQKYYFAFYKLYTDKENNFETEGFDRAVWRIARIYEIAADITDMSRAYQWYTLLPDICPFSSYVEQARRKAEYIDRHFLNIR